MTKRRIIITEEQFNRLILNNARKDDNIYVLVACEESQAITIAFRKRGIIAFSNDLVECSGGHPEWHIKGDCLPLIYGDNHSFRTEDGEIHFVEHWNLIVAHPPCTYLTTSGNRWFNVEKYGDKALQRIKDREEARKFFMKFTDASADHIAIENPVGYMSTVYRKPNQIIQPWMFGDNDVKTTCLWTKNLPNLETDIKEKPNGIEYKEWIANNGEKKRQTISSYSPEGRNNERQRMRSKTYQGIANAIAKQWGDVLKREKEEKENA